MADEQSTQAAWFTLAEIKELKVRGLLRGCLDGGQFVINLCEYLANGGKVHPLSLWTRWSSELGQP